jgi:hypothetical protein
MLVRYTGQVEACSPNLVYEKRKPASFSYCLLALGMLNIGESLLTGTAKATTVHIFPLEFCNSLVIAMDLEAAVRQSEQELMSKPNVTGVGIGERDGKPVIKVFVQRKLPKSELSKKEIVPRKIGKYPTDVVEIGTVPIQHN